MEILAQERLESEAQNWLNRGRAHLLAQLLRRHAAKGLGEAECLELGAGAGQNLGVLARFGPVDAVEVSPFFADRLKKLALARDVYQQPIPELSLSRSYDVICAMDVLEHIQDDDLALDWIYQHLNEGGLFVGTVPAYQWLFSDHDRANQHYRRYTSSRLKRLVGRKLEIRQSGYFNTVLFPIAVSGRAMWQARQAIFGKGYEKVKQSSRLPGIVDLVFGRVLIWEAERIARGATHPVGLSAFCAARRA